MTFEVSQTPDLERRLRVELLMRSIQTFLSVEDLDVERAGELEAIGFHAIDALHIALAERGAAEIFLTTDDRLLRRANHESAQLRVRVENPLTWLQEIARP
jgi:predicted nucleic acid-binding protein